MKQFEGFPCIMVNGLWWVRNSSIFRNVGIPPATTTSLIINISKDFIVDAKEKNHRFSILPDMDLDISWGLFDGAIQGHPPVCAVGVVLFLK
jgi:hypothetical protein